MKRTILMTILGASLALGPNSAFANGSCLNCSRPAATSRVHPDQGGCPNCSRPAAALSTWQQIQLFLSMLVAV
jgi:hypothetical protein